MLRSEITFALIFSGLSAFAQTSPTDPQFEAQVIGGKQQIDQVFQTQMTLPKQIGNSGFESDFTCFFDLDSSGQALHLKFVGQVPLAISKEVQRLFRFYHFRLTLDLPDESRPYFLKFSLSSDKYKAYIKQKNKF